MVTENNIITIFFFALFILFLHKKVVYTISLLLYSYCILIAFLLHPHCILIASLLDSYCIPIGFAGPSKK